MLHDFLHHFCDIWIDMAPWLLAGFFLAFICSYFLSERWIRRHLGGRGWLPVLKASFMGLPLPICSCGVLLVALALRKSGARKAPVCAFLASTPQSGTDALLVSLPLLGPLFTLLRFLGAFCSGIAAGAVAIAIPEIPFDAEAAIAKIKSVKADGKRGMIVVVSEGVKTADGQKIGEYLTKQIEAETGIETRFARFAHIVRGGSPTLRDRLTATQMGAQAVELLLEGRSDVVICEIDGVIKPIEINFSLILDRMYKNKLKDGDLDAFDPEQIAEMKAICAKRSEEIRHMYELSHTICK